MGLVICNPFGNEAVSAHRSLRQLADAAARAGMATLRFDYDGAGDSAGHDMDPNRIAAWLASVRHACDKLREDAGLERLCLVGVRLGAMLAALEAARRTDVAGLIAIAPVVSGRTYARELYVMRRAIDSKRNITRGTNEDILETAGFLLSAQTRQSLGEIDLNRMETAPAGRVLILDRAEMPSAESWARRLDSLGVHCERTNVSGYAQMMLDAHESIPPVEIIATAVKWARHLAQGAVKDNPARSRPASQPRAHLPHTTCQDPIGIAAPAVPVEETAVLLGETPGLFGIVSASATPPQQQGTPGSGKALILLNAGAVHHIGPNRLHVTLARNLARAGHVVLRLDIAGIGDSAPRGGDAENVVYSQRAISAIQEAIQYLHQSWNVREVLAAGVCSGAYHAFKAAAVTRLPLACVILINPLTFFWKEGMSLQYPEHRIAADMARYRISTLRLSSWMKLLSGGVNLVELTHVLARRADAIARKPVRSLARLLRIPLRDDLPAELSGAVQAGTYLQFVFATNDPGLELLQEQGGATVDRLHTRGKLGIEVIEGADHTFTDLAARARLAALIAEHLSRNHT
jgi:alpha-beta hydrolase superfamily lysophospholipase